MSIVKILPRISRAFVAGMALLCSDTAFAQAGERLNNNRSVVEQRARRAVADDWVVRGHEPTAPRLVYTAAWSLGMLRGLGEADVLVRLRYQGSAVSRAVTRTGVGPATNYDKYYVEISYPERGMRVDTTAGGKRQVQVVAGEAAWDEVGVTADGPPVGKSQKLTPANLEERQLWLRMTPYAVIKAAHRNIEQVKVTALEHGMFKLTFSDGGQLMNVTLDRNRRPEKVETDFVHPIAGKTTLTAEYSAYKDYEPLDPQLSDEPYSDFFFPSRIVQKVGSRAVLEANIATCWCVNPYVIFVPPEK